MSTYKFLLLGLISLIFSGLALAQSTPRADRCQDQQKAAQAEATLRALRIKLNSERPDLAALVAQAVITTCSPSSVYIATLPPGSVRPGNMMANICGADLLFSNAEKQSAVAKWIQANVPNAPICVDQLAAKPWTPVVSSGN